MSFTSAAEVIDRIQAKVEVRNPGIDCPTPAEGENDQLVGRVCSEESCYVSPFFLSVFVRFSA